MQGIKQSGNKGEIWEKEQLAGESGPEHPKVVWIHGIEEMNGLKGWSGHIER